jgi:hypothetical protein
MKDEMKETLIKAIEESLRGEYSKRSGEYSTKQSPSFNKEIASSNRTSIVGDAPPVVRFSSQ